MLAGCVEDEAPPSAPDVEKPLGWLQSQLVTDQRNLLFLCHIERLLRVPEISARVSKRFPQPGPKEFHRLIVMVRYRRLISSPRVPRSMSEKAPGSENGMHEFFPH